MNLEGMFCYVCNFPEWLVNYASEIPLFVKSDSQLFFNNKEKCEHKNGNMNNWDTRKITDNSNLLLDYYFWRD